MRGEEVANQQERGSVEEGIGVDFFLISTDDHTYKMRNYKANKADDSCISDCQTSEKRTNDEDISTQFFNIDTQTLSCVFAGGHNIKGPRLKREIDESDDCEAKAYQEGNPFGMSEDMGKISHKDWQDSSNIFLIDIHKKRDD